MKEEVIFSAGKKDKSDIVTINVGCSVLMIKVVLSISLIAAIIYVLNCFN
jgi:hypothetical protein